MISYLENEAVISKTLNRTDSYPTSLLDAYTLTNNWKEVRHRSMQRGGSVTVFAATTRSAGKPKNQDAKKAKTKGKNTKTGGKVGNESDPPSSNSATSQEKSPITCRTCGKEGHKSMNCPHKTDVQQAITDSDEAERALAAFVIVGNQRTIRMISAMSDADYGRVEEYRVMMSKSGRSSHVTIILDNAAQASLFTNKGLLEEIRMKDTPLVYRGITSAEISVKHEGKWYGLSLDYSKSVDANTLSFSQIIDTNDWGVCCSIGLT